MKPISEYLLPDECRALFSALRRDAECERFKAVSHPEFAGYHLQNARLNVRILEAFGYREDRFEAGSHFR